MKKVVVIDAQGGGLGVAVVKKLCEKYEGRIDILALGTNVVATSAMKKSGASDCATGMGSMLMWTLLSFGIALRTATQTVSSRRLGQKIYQQIEEEYYV